MRVELQVKQFVATVTNKGMTFNVYTTGDPQFYLFKPTHNGCEGTIDIPTKKMDLKDNIRKALAHGISITVN
jgi:hypothetical protein